MRSNCVSSKSAQRNYNTTVSVAKRLALLASVRVFFKIKLHLARKPSTCPFSSNYLYHPVVKSVSQRYIIYPINKSFSALQEMHDHDRDINKLEGQPSGRTQQQYTLTAPIEIRVHKLESTRDDIIEKVKV